MYNAEIKSDILICSIPGGTTSKTSINMIGVFFISIGCDLIKRIPRGFASGFQILSPENQGRCQPAFSG